VTAAADRKKLQHWRLTVPLDYFTGVRKKFDDAGIDRVDRKYLAWVDTPKSLYCGQGFFYPNDTRADPTPGANSNNANPGAHGLLARVDAKCWGQTNMVEAHELLHTLGGVLRAKSGVADSPPNATNQGHCTDESDRLCYADGEPSGNGAVFRADGSSTAATTTISPPTRRRAIGWRTIGTPPTAPG